MTSELLQIYAGVRLQDEYARERQPLFRFYDARNEFFKDSLEHLICQNELYLSSRKNFNDPFDVNPVLKCDWTPAEIPRHAEKLLSNPLSASDPVAAVQRMFSAGIVGKKSGSIKGQY